MSDSPSHVMPKCNHVTHPTQHTTLEHQRTRDTPAHRETRDAKATRQRSSRVGKRAAATVLASLVKQKASRKRVGSSSSCVLKSDAPFLEFTLMDAIFTSTEKNTLEVEILDAYFSEHGEDLMREEHHLHTEHLHTDHLHRDHLHTDHLHTDHRQSKEADTRSNIAQVLDGFVSSSYVTSPETYSTK